MLTLIWWFDEKQNPSKEHYASASLRCPTCNIRVCVDYHTDPTSYLFTVLLLVPIPLERFLWQVSCQSQDSLGNTPTLLYQTTISALVSYQIYSVPYENVRLCRIHLTFLGVWHMTFCGWHVLGYLRSQFIPSTIWLNDLCVLDPRSVKPDLQASLLAKCLVLNYNNSIYYFDRKSAIT